MEIASKTIESLPAFLVVLSLIILFFLAVIDLKTRLLPNRYVFPFFILGIIFHISTNFQTTTPVDMLLGGLIGGGFLLAIRTVANRIYKRDTLGLGDVKLMLAAGVWLGADFILPAISLGALLGLAHGLGVAFYIRAIRKETLDFSSFAIPAGPGFIGGIVILAFIKFKDLLF